MPTENPRVNITLQAETVRVLAQIAKKEKKSLSSVAKELVLEALELREDLWLSQIALLRDTEGVKKVSHEDAWK